MLKTAVCVGGADMRPWPSVKKVRAQLKHHSTLINHTLHLKHHPVFPSPDMHTYGHCPSHDDFYLVVCNHCGQVVKPEAFEKHCVRRHEPLTKMCGQLSTLAPQQRPRPGKPPSNLSSSRERQKEGRHQEENARLPAVLPVHPRRPSKAQREAARYCLRLIITSQGCSAWVELDKFTMSLTELCVTCRMHQCCAQARPLLCYESILKCSSPILFPVCHQRRSSFKRSLPTNTTHHPHLGPGFLHGIQGPCPLAPVLPPLPHQRNPPCRRSQLDRPVSLTVLCGEQEPTARFIKT